MLTNIQIDIELIRKFNGKALLNKRTYLDTRWRSGYRIPEVIAFKQHATINYIEHHGAVVDESRTYYETQAMSYPEVTPQRKCDD